MALLPFILMLIAVILFVIEGLPAATGKYNLNSWGLACMAASFALQMTP